jgi:hypothetical protein
MDYISTLSPIVYATAIVAYGIGSFICGIAIGVIYMRGNIPTLDRASDR